jgi:hypothetical protein
MLRRRHHSASIQGCNHKPSRMSKCQREARFRQVRKGFATEGFVNYTLCDDFGFELLPIPDTRSNDSKRVWDARLTIWRRALHDYDRRGAAITGDKHRSSQDFPRNPSAPVRPANLRCADSGAPRRRRRGVRLCTQEPPLADQRPRRRSL